MAIYNKTDRNGKLLTKQTKLLSVVPKIPFRITTAAEYPKTLKNPNCRLPRVPSRRSRQFFFSFSLTEIRSSLRRDLPLMKLLQPLLNVQQQQILKALFAHLDPKSQRVDHLQHLALTAGRRISI